jgi:hypothetical protein
MKIQAQTFKDLCQLTVNVGASYILGYSYVYIGLL